MPNIVLVVMGVSGCGKTTIAKGVAETKGWLFQEGDELHPAANVAKMRAGVPLTDEDRAPWLDAVWRWIEDRDREGRSGIVTCSALKRAYRDRLRQDHPQLRFVLLDASREVLAARLAKRQGHYMPASLLDSQLATLERPTPDENILVLNVERPPDVSIAELLDWLDSQGLPTR